MKTKAGKIIFSCIAVIVGIIAITILLLAIKTDRKSAEEIESIDKIIEQYEEETTHEEVTTVDPVTTEPVMDIETTEETTTELSSYSIEELVNYVLDHGLNGDEREEYLGDRYEEVQKWIDANYVPPVRYVEAEEPEANVYYPSGGGVLTPSAGVNYYNGRMETYYNLDMSGVLDIMYSLGYSGDYWVRGDGVKMFGGYVMVACDFGEYPRGSIIETSLGTAMVCDTGSGGWGWTDIAVTW